MEKLKGKNALNLILKKFSDSCGVVKCVLDFYKSMAQAEENYAANIKRIIKAGAAFGFRSTFLMQLLEMSPHEELKSLKESWLTLGRQLSLLMEHHFAKSKSYSSDIRQPLLDLLPQLEETKRKLKRRSAELVAKLEISEKKTTATKKRYYEAGDRYQRIEADLTKARNSSNQKLIAQMEVKLSHQVSEVENCENRYKKSLEELQEAYSAFDTSVVKLFKEIEECEVQRIKVVASSIKEFTKILSNTSPIYLEGMQRITLSVDEISAEVDIETFVDSHKDLLEEITLPIFEPHPCKIMIGATATSSPPSTDTAAGLDSGPEDAQGSPTRDQPTSADTNKQSSPNGPSSVPPPNEDPTEITRPKPPAKPIKIRSLSSSTNNPPNSEATLARTKSPSVGQTRKAETLDPGGPSKDQHVHNDSLEVLLLELQGQVTVNDYYKLLGASPSANEAELAKCRRERNQELHPDHFNQQPEQRRSAEEKLSQINQVYTNVLKPPGTRELYDQLCSFRKSYGKFASQDIAKLNIAKARLLSLKASLKKSSVPQALLHEIESAIEIIDLRLDT